MIQIQIQIYAKHVDSPLGGIMLTSDGENLTGLWFDDRKSFEELPGIQQEETLPVFDETQRWLDLYFSRKDPGFTPPVSLHSLHCSAFRRSVLEVIQAIPYGKTMTYGEISSVMSRKAGQKPPSAQAVGGAAANNPILLIIPCHRVVGKDGNLKGYAGGAERKRWLLRQEGANLPGLSGPGWDLACSRFGA